MYLFPYTHCMVLYIYCIYDIYVTFQLQFQLRISIILFPSTAPWKRCASPPQPHLSSAATTLSAKWRATPSQRAPAARPSSPPPSPRRRRPLTLPSPPPSPKIPRRRLLLRAPASCRIPSSTRPASSARFPPALAQTAATATV